MRRIFFLGILGILGIFSRPIHGEDRRVIPLDMYLIIDGSASFENSKNDTIAWIGSHVVDRLLTEGDKITIWNAGDKAELIHSETISGAEGKKGIMDKLLVFNTDGKSADFSGALRDAGPKVSETPGDRMAYTMLIAGSAEALKPAMTGNSGNPFRWFRSEKYERWQVLIVAPDIGKKVRDSGAAYMSSLR